MTKKEKELSSFRIGDIKRPEVRSFTRPQKSGGGEQQPASQSAGFPNIEQRLEKGTIEDLAEALRPSYEKLESLAASGDIKAKAAAKKAMAAYERTADLFEYLFETKANLQTTSSSTTVVDSPGPAKPAR